MTTASTKSVPAPVVCPPRERNTAIAALVLALFVALVLCIAAWLASARAGDAAGGGALVGQTPGSGGGPGTGVEGDGPGAGLSGTGRGRDGTGDAPPRGVPEGGAAETTTDAERIAAAAAPPVEPPKFGFTRPEAPPTPVETPQPAPAPSGVADGGGAPGHSGAGKGGTGTEFMGVRTAANRVVYVIDQSGSMAGLRFAHTTLELRRSIERLPTEGAFLVVFFNTSAIPMPPGRLVPATQRNKSDGVDWIRQQTVGGGTDPTQALEVALREPRPDAIFLMTDGEFSPGPVFAVINQLNADRKVSINTIGFHSRAAEAVLKQIAAENRGDYTYIPPPSTP